MRLDQAFSAEMGQWLEHEAHIPHRWKRDSDVQSLALDAYEPDGFPVNANATEEFVFVILDRTLIVEFWVSDAQSPGQVLEKAMGLVRICLSDHARLRQTCVGNRAHVSTLEVLTQGVWQQVKTHRAWLYNWFGAKTERVLTNAWISLAGAQ